MKKSKAFTLIELLVVIAIIGILASIVLVNLNTARKKAKDAAIKGNMASLGAASAMFADDSSDVFTGFCADDTYNVAGIIAAVGGITATSACVDDANEWAACGQLIGVPADYWCSDSNGSAKAITGTCSAAAVEVVAGTVECP